MPTFVRIKTRSIFLGEFECKGTTKSSNRQTFLFGPKSAQMPNFL